MKRKAQASLPTSNRSRRSHRKQNAGCVKKEKERDVCSSNLTDMAVSKKNFKHKPNVPNAKHKASTCKEPSVCPATDENCKNLVVPDQIDENRRSTTTAASPQTSQPMLPASGVHQPIPSVAEALKKLLSAVRSLFNQHCLLAMMDVDIQLGGRSDVPFQPKQEDWPELQKHLQLLLSCLQDLQRLINSQQPAATSQSPDPAAYEEDQPPAAGGVSAPAAAGPLSAESVSRETSAERHLSPPPPPPPPSPTPPAPKQEQAGEDQREGQEEGEDPDWDLAEEAGVDSPEPPPAADGHRASRRRDPPRPFACTLGGCQQRPGVPRTFASEKSLKMHLVASHGLKSAGRRYHEYTCPLCRSVQKRPRDLAAHIVTCQGKGETRPRLAASEGADDPSSDGGSFIMCRLCHLCFPTGDLLRAHVCQYADSGGVIQELLGTGTLSVSGGELSALRRFICHQCREEFRNQAIYRVHLQFCRPPPYACELCNAELPCGRQLVLHKMNEHRGLNKPMFFCRAAGCGLSFRLNAALQKHLVQRHSSQPTGQPHGCDVCDKKFIKKIYLTHHKLRYHHDTLQRDFVCEVCGARLGSSSALSVHVRSVHTRPEYTCDVCGKVFSRQDRLAIHAKIHTGVKPYKCSLCPKAFIQQCKLNDHLRRHRGERRFRCVMCDKMYAASHDLRSHLRRIHNVDMVNKTHTIQPTASLLRPLPPPEPEPEPELEPEQEPEPMVQEPERAQQLSTVVPQTLQSVQLHSVQVTAPAQTLHVQDLSQLGGGLILIPAVDASGGTSFYPIINQ